MSVLNSKIILCKDINLDKDYRNVLNYSESDMVSLCNNKALIIKDHYSFIKPSENRISIEASYGECLQCNYIAFQNPYYSNKWFFAFIDGIEYSSEKATIINYTIDAWSTWFSSINPQKCFVLREHVNDDSVGANTVHEGLETGNYICNSADNITIGTADMICCYCTDFPILLQQYFKKSKYNGIYSGAKAVIFASVQDASNFVTYMEAQQKGDAIIAMFMVPNSLIAGDLTFFTRTLDLDPSLFVVDHVDVTFSPVDETDGESFMGDFNVTRNSTLNGYTPKNNKLFTAEFNYFYISNNAGSDVDFHYEDFVNNTPSFELDGALTPGGSIKLFPKNYNKLSDGSGTNYAFNYGITGAKYPICSWKSDSYTTWLSENSLNLALDKAKTIGQLALGGVLLASGAGTLAGGALLAGGGVSLFESMKTKYEHSRIPDQAKGNVNAGDVQFSIGKNCFTLFKMSVKYEFAKRIDDYLTRFGYKVDNLKVPNITGRRYWNFIQIADSEDIGSGSVPNNYLETINNICRRGVTIWHNHDNIGNYDLTNSIVS